MQVGLLMWDTSWVMLMHAGLVDNSIGEAGLIRVIGCIPATHHPDHSVMD